MQGSIGLVAQQRYRPIHQHPQLLDRPALLHQHQHGHEVVDALEPVGIVALLIQDMVDGRPDAIGRSPEGVSGLGGHEGAARLAGAFTAGNWPATICCGFGSGGRENTVIKESADLVAIELFAGAGGLAEGLQAAGIRVVLAQELHPQPGLTHAFNHPGTTVMVGDIRQLDIEVMGRLIREAVGDRCVDIVTGGPPCQGFSSAGKKEFSDPRNSLFRQFCRVVEYFRPKVILLENVPGFKMAYSGKVYDEAVREFSVLGYRLDDAVLNALEFGLPQRRQRFVMVGVRKDLDIEFRWPRPTHRNPDKRVVDLFDASLPPANTVLDALGDLAFTQPGFEAHRHATAALSNYARERREGCELLFNHLTTRHREKAEEMFRHIPEGGTISQVPEEKRSAKRTMARMSRRGVSNAVLALPDDMIHYEQDRIPSVREMARLQSFDDDFVFMGKRTSGFMERSVDVPQYTQVGNAVPPLLGRVLGIALVQTLGGKPHDLRDKAARRRRHNWLRGSSGFTGYGLGPEAHLPLCDLQGNPIELPIDDAQRPVASQPPLVEWRRAGRTGLKRQWAPGVAEPDASAYHRGKRGKSVQQA